VTTKTERHNHCIIITASGREEIPNFSNVEGKRFINLFLVLGALCGITARLLLSSKLLNEKSNLNNK
jgi:hypothetical protein